MGDLVVDARRDGVFGLIRLKGEARLEEIDSLRTAARALLAEGAKHVLVGVRDLAFTDSASIGALMELQKECTAKGGAFVLHGCTARFLKLLEAMGLGTRFKTAVNEAAAKKAV